MNHSPDDEFGVKAKVILIHAETEKQQICFNFPDFTASGFEAVIYLHRECFWVQNPGTESK